MKRPVTAEILITSTMGSFSQVSIKPVPASGYEKSIRYNVGLLKVVDSHEHH